MDKVLSSTQCGKLEAENTQFREERSGFLWQLAWTGEFLKGHLHASLVARKLYGEIDELLGRSEEGRYVRDVVNDPRNAQRELEAA